MTTWLLLGGGGLFVLALIGRKVASKESLTNTKPTAITGTGGKMSIGAGTPTATKTVSNLLSKSSAAPLPPSAPKNVFIAPAPKAPVISSVSVSNQSLMTKIGKR